MTPPPCLGLYLHVPFCKHACPYCDFYKIELRDRPARDRLDFPERLARELELLLAAHPGLSARPLATIYFGGGTPSTLEPGSVARLLHRIDTLLPAPASAREVTLEANPENLTPARCQRWAHAGINRLSIGVQSFAAGDLALLERLHAPELIPAVVANARAAGITNLSLDLMFALPGQTTGEWLASLHAALALEPDHISFYGLTYHERTPFHDALLDGRLLETDEDTQAEMYLAGAELLAAHGYEHYEISNFARPGARSRHNQRYWTRADVLGLGPGAHSNLGARRWANPEDLDAWAGATDAGHLARGAVEELDTEAALSERLFTHLRRREGLSAAIDPALFARAGEWARRSPTYSDLYHADDARFQLTPRGWLLADAVVREILRTEPATDG